MLIMALAWVFASQRRASARHLSWAGAFGAVLILPLLALIVPSPLRILLPAPPEAIPVPVAERRRVGRHYFRADRQRNCARSNQHRACAWRAGLLGIAILSLRFAVSAICLASLRRRSRPFALRRTTCRASQPLVANANCAFPIRKTGLSPGVYSSLSSFCRAPRFSGRARGFTPCCCMSSPI